MKNTKEWITSTLESIKSHIPQHNKAEYEVWLKNGRKDKLVFFEENSNLIHRTILTAQLMSLHTALDEIELAEKALNVVTDIQDSLIGLANVAKELSDKAKLP